MLHCHQQTFKFPFLWIPSSCQKYFTWPASQDYLPLLDPLIVSFKHLHTLVFDFQLTDSRITKQEFYTCKDVSARWEFVIFLFPEVCEFLQWISIGLKNGLKNLRHKVWRYQLLCLHLKYFWRAIEECGLESFFQSNQLWKPQGSQRVKQFDSLGILVSYWWAEPWRISSVYLPKSARWCHPSLIIYFCWTSAYTSCTFHMIFYYCIRDTLSPTTRL